MVVKCHGVRGNGDTGYGVKWGIGKEGERNTRKEIIEVSIEIRNGGTGDKPRVPGVP